MLIVHIKLRVAQKWNRLLQEMDSLSLLLTISKLMMQMTWEPISHVTVFILMINDTGDFIG